MSVAVCLSDHGIVRRRSGAGRAPAFGFALGFLIAVCSPGLALGKDDDEEDTTEKAPNLYLDFNTVTTALPAGALGIGFKNFTSLPTLNSPASQSVTQNVPMTLDLNDRITVYGGFSGSTYRTDDTSWSSLAIDSWSVGFQADVIAQNGGPFPTMTLQSTLTRTVGSAAPATTFTNILEFDYALDADETRGLLAGVRHAKVVLDSEFAKIEPSITGYLGAYYQWPSNWKLSGRFGVQSFGGATILNQMPFKPFTQPMMRFDLERMDDDDNRLFGVTAEISWMPKPAYQLTLRTPLYAIKN